MSLGVAALWALALIVLMIVIIVVYSMDPEGRMPYWPIIGLGIGFVAEAVFFIVFIIGIVRNLQ